MSPLCRCAGCGAVVDPARMLSFRCPHADERPEIDHVLTPVADPAALAFGTEANPFLRYRGATLAGRFAAAAGISAGAYADIVGDLDAALLRVDGRGCRVTPFTEQPTLAQAIGTPGLRLWVKDETGNVAGSHKARHLIGVMLYLRVVETARLPAGKGLRTRPLAIASCGNAALAASVVARAANWPLEVFIPTDAEPRIVARMRDLGADVRVCPRQEGALGDPCVRAFRAAVAEGALPFGAQGPDNGLAVEGSALLACEMAEALAARGESLDSLFLQVGGGALASGVAQGFAALRAAGLIGWMPRLFAVQTEGCHPLERAFARLRRAAAELGPEPALAYAACHRADFMVPWETPPRSLAHGILDDETYDWLAVTAAQLRTGGDAVVVDEATVRRAYELGRAHTGINASPTGTAGLAGVLMSGARGQTGVIFSGVGG